VLAATLVSLAVATCAAPALPFPRIANCHAVGLTPSSTDADVAEVARLARIAHMDGEILGEHARNVAVGAPQQASHR